MKLTCFGFLLAFMCSAAFGQIVPTKTCDSAGIGSVKLTADAPVTIVSISTGTAGTGTATVPYCLVKVRVSQAVNIWFGLPMAGKWNGRLQSEGGGGYAGQVGVPTGSTPQPGRRSTDELPFASQENLFEAVVNWVEHG